MLASLRRTPGPLFTLTACTFMFAAKANAHGSPPAATAALAVAGDNVTIVGLTRGLAHRAGDHFNFVCPERWGGDATAPAAGIPGGPAVVASDGLFLVDSDGKVAAHPNQVGTGIALASNGAGLFGLFLRDGHYDLRHITETTSDLVRLFVEPFGALAASDDTLWLLRWVGQTLTLQTVSFSGELADPVTWLAPSVVSYAELRIADGQPYVAIWGSATPWVTLGRVGDRGYEPLAEAGSEITGPVALHGDTFIARDGAFERVVEGMPPAPGADYITCLSSYQGHPYACSHGDLVRVDENGPGSPLFELAALREPDYAGLSETARMDCAARWNDLQHHVAPGSATTDAGADAPNSPDAADSATPAGPDTAGCSVRPGAERHASWLSFFSLIVLARALSTAANKRKGGPRRRGSQR